MPFLNKIFPILFLICWITNTLIILDYVKNKGGEHAMDLLKGALM